MNADEALTIADNPAQDGPHTWSHCCTAAFVLAAEVRRLQGLVDQAAELKTVGGIRPGYQERGQWERGTLPPPASATDGPAVVGSPERSAP